MRSAISPREWVLGLVVPVAVIVVLAGIGRGSDSSVLFIALIALVPLLAALVVPLTVRLRSQSRLAQCTANLQRISQAVTLYANENEGRLPERTNAPAPGAWSRETRTTIRGWVWSAMDRRSPVRRSVGR